MNTGADIFDAMNLPVDPAMSASYPRGLALDLALEVGTLKEILESYDITPERFKRILQNTAFRQEFEAHKESVATEGWSFKKKAQAQAELYLNLTYRLATSDQTPAAVRLDAIKSTVKWAGLDTPPGSANKEAALIPEIVEQLKTLTDGELEVRVMQLVMRRAPPAAPTPGGALIEHGL